MSLHNIFRSERNINIICILKRDIHLPLSIKYLPITIRMKAKLLFMAFALCATFYSARVFSQEYQNGVFWIMFSQNEILARNETETTDERRITDLKGSILGLKELTKNQDKLEMNIDKFPSGKYLVELWSETGRIESRIIVKM